MKIIPGKMLMAITAMVLYVPAVYSHTSGEHSGGLLQQVMHILQSADHLFIILALGVLVSLIYRLAKKQDR